MKTQNTTPSAETRQGSAVTHRTVSGRLWRLEGRAKREGREVAGVRRLGVLHYHSTITETVLGLLGYETPAAKIT